MELDSIERTSKESLKFSKNTEPVARSGTHVRICCSRAWPVGRTRWPGRRRPRGSRWRSWWRSSSGVICTQRRSRNCSRSDRPRIRERKRHSKPLTSPCCACTICPPVSVHRPRSGSPFCSRSAGPPRAPPSAPCPGWWRSPRRSGCSDNRPPRSSPGGGWRRWPVARPTPSWPAHCRCCSFAGGPRRTPPSPASEAMPSPTGETVAAASGTRSSARSVPDVLSTIGGRRAPSAALFRPPRGTHLEEPRYGVRRSWRKRGFSGRKSYSVGGGREGAWSGSTLPSSRVNWHVHESPSRLAASPRIERGRREPVSRGCFDWGRMRGREIWRGRARVGGAKSRLELEVRSTLSKVSRGRMLGD